MSFNYTNYLQFPSTGFGLLTDLNVFPPSSINPPNLPDASINVVASNSDGSILYVIASSPDISGSEQYALYRSTDLGQNYTFVSGIDPSFNIIDQGSILSVSEDGNVLLLIVTYIGSFDSVFYSNNGGSTFTNITAISNYGSIVSPNGTANYIQQGNPDGIFTWNGSELVELFVDPSFVHVQFISTSYDGKYVFATPYDADSYVLYSSDYGATWFSQFLTSPNGYYLTGSAMAWDSSVYYTYLINSSNGSILGTARSWDQGQTWQFFENNGLNFSYNYQLISTSPDGRYVYLNDDETATLYISVNYGVSFQPFPYGFTQYNTGIINNRSVVGITSNQIELVTNYQYLLYLSSYYGNTYLTY
jgi:hypothetical protein